VSGVSTWYGMNGVISVTSVSAVSTATGENGVGVVSVRGTVHGVTLQRL
jgi:hypothetical protein